MSCQETHKNLPTHTDPSQIVPWGSNTHDSNKANTHTHTWILTCDNAVVGRFQHGSIKLNDVLMTQDTENLSLDEQTRTDRNKGLWTTSFTSSISFQISDIGKETRKETRSSRKSCADHSWKTVNLLVRVSILKLLYYRWGLNLFHNTG